MHLFLRVNLIQVLSLNEIAFCSPLPFCKYLLLAERRGMDAFKQLSLFFLPQKEKQWVSIKSLAYTSFLLSDNGFYSNEWYMHFQHRSIRFSQKGLYENGNDLHKTYPKAGTK